MQEICFSPLLTGRHSAVLGKGKHLVMPPGAAEVVFPGHYEKPSPHPDDEGFLVS